jgi:catechol O-methyltransferase
VAVERLTEIGGRRMPFLRWSFVRMAVGMPKLQKEWQVGDGRDKALGQYVLAKPVGVTSMT